MYVDLTEKKRLSTLREEYRNETSDDANASYWLISVNLSNCRLYRACSKIWLFFCTLYVGLFSGCYRMWLRILLQFNSFSSEFKKKIIIRRLFSVIIHFILWNCTRCLDLYWRICRKYLQLFHCSLPCRLYTIVTIFYGVNSTCSSSQYIWWWLPIKFSIS